MPSRDAIGGLVFLALGAAGLYWAVDLPFGDARLPGPAMLPSTLSALIIVFAAVHLVRALRRGRVAAGSVGPEPEPRRASRAPPIPASQFRRVGEAALLIALYVALLRPLGFIVTTFVCMSALYLIADERGFGLRPFVSGAVLTVVTYVLFKSLLEVPLPAGTLWD